MDNLTPITREEILMNDELLTPITREEKILTGEDLNPVTRREYFLKKYRHAGGDVMVEELSVTENGTYTAPEGKAYSPVEVAVPMPENAYLLKEASGSLVSFSDGADLPMPSFVCDIDAVQDLHGYDSPWVGGAGKNMLPLIIDQLKTGNTAGTWSGNTYTYNGIAYTVLTDNNNNITGINANGTATDISFFNIDFGGQIPVGDYYANGGANGGSYDTYDVYFYNTTSNVRMTKWDGTTPSDSLFNTTTSAEIRVPNTTDALRYRIRIRSGVKVENITFYPMVRLATETDPTFAPYSNICPISGWTEEVITVTDDTTTPTVEQTYTIPFTDGQGQSVEVFGGSVDVVNGTSGNKLTHGFVVLNGSNTENWTTDVPSSGKRRFSCDTLPSLGYTDDTRIHAISNYYKNTTSTIYDTMSEVFILRYINGTNRIDIMTEVFQTVEELTAFLSQTPLQIRYELATPTTFYTQPISIKSLDGENNVSASTGEIETLEYFTKEA